MNINLNLSTFIDRISSQLKNLQFGDLKQNLLKTIPLSRNAQIVAMVSVTVFITLLSLVCYRRKFSARQLNAGETRTLPTPNIGTSTTTAFSSSTAAPAASSQRSAETNLDTDDDAAFLSALEDSDDDADFFDAKGDDKVSDADSSGTDDGVTGAVGSDDNNADVHVDTSLDILPSTPSRADVTREILTQIHTRLHSTVTWGEAGGSLGKYLFEHVVNVHSATCCTLNGNHFSISFTETRTKQITTFPPNTPELIRKSLVVSGIEMILGNEISGVFHDDGSVEFRKDGVVLKIFGREIHVIKMKLTPNPQQEMKLLITIDTSSLDESFGWGLTAAGKRAVVTLIEKATTPVGDLRAKMVDPALLVENMHQCLPEIM